jgi:hypothetical protein
VESGDAVLRDGHAVLIVCARDSDCDGGGVRRREEREKSSKGVEEYAMCAGSSCNGEV